MSVQEGVSPPYAMPMRNTSWLLLAPLLLALGCPRRMETMDAAIVADAVVRVDVARLDTPLPPDASFDAAADGGTDAFSPPDVGRDAPEDARSDAPSLCTISTGDSPRLDGTDDLAEYPAVQRLTLGAPLNAGDEAAITWNATSFFATFTSDAFRDGAFEPVHLYVEASSILLAPVASVGKEYASLSPGLPFSATHLIALRRTSDSGLGGPYNGVYSPAGSWATRTTPLNTGTDVFTSADGRTISVRVPWSALGGCPTRMRLVAHIVHAEVANEWKATVPSTHTPWMPSGGAFYDIDLTGDPAVSGWVVR